MLKMPIIGQNACFDTFA